MSHTEKSGVGLLAFSLMVMLVHSLPMSTSTTTMTTDLQQQQQQHLPQTQAEHDASLSSISSTDSDNSLEKAEVNTKMAEDFLWQYGYLQKRPDVPGMGNRHKRAAEGGAMSKALRAFQKYFGLKESGQLDSATMALMRKDRCGVKDITEQPAPSAFTDYIPNKQQSPSDFTLLGTKWDKTTLTWNLKTPTRQLHPKLQRDTIRDALDVWRQVAPLEFRETKGKADIVIKFGVRRHGDDYPFDGKGKVLAHAFGPGSAPISGDMHLDNEETWSVTDQNEYGTSDLFLVATHELGHSLGLAHSSDASALMYPYYGMTDTLGPDDIKAIQSLYGARIGAVKPKPRRRRPSSITTTTQSSASRFPWAKSATHIYRLPSSRSTPRPSCQRHFDVVITDDTSYRNVYTGIEGDLVYRFDQSGLLSGYPSTLDSVYPGAPTGADAVFTITEDSSTYFVKGHRVWRYRQSLLQSGYPKDLNPAHFPEGIRFVLTMVDMEGIRRVFVFGRSKWLEYNFDSPPSYVPHTYPISLFSKDITPDVKYAVSGYDDNTYLVSADSHVVLDSFRRTIRGGKQEGDPYWLLAACQFSGSSSVHSLGATVISLLLMLVLIY